MLMPSIFGEDLFDDFMNDFPFYNDRDMKKLEKKLYGHHAKNMMKTDIKESDTENEQEKETGKYIRRERYAGSCERSFYVGEDITKDDIKCEFKHGILKMNISKKEAKPTVEANKYITIEG